MISKKATMFLQYFMVCLICQMTVVRGFPSAQCKDGKFFDHLKQIYLPCSECDKKQIGCQVCCNPNRKGLMDPSRSSYTVPMPSLEEEAKTANYHILNVFLQSFVITMVACTLLVLVYVAYKVARERREAECQQGNRFHNADANVVQEVFTVDPAQSTATEEEIYDSTAGNTQDSLKETSQVNITVNKLPKAAAKGAALSQKQKL